MKVRAKKAAPQHKGETPKPPAVPYTFPAPIRGWVLNENLSQVEPGGASVLDNWICTTTGILARDGCVAHATVPSPALSMFSYAAGAVKRLFAATATAIYDVTAPLTPETALVAAVSGLTGGEYSATQFGTAGGNFLIVANGKDPVRNFDGSAWVAASITGVTSSALSYVWGYANRLFFVESGTLNFWYLPVDSIGGAAQQFSLGGVFTRGGTLLFGAKWSMDAGDGLDDKCVFVSTEGEVAIYEGTNPGDATNWHKVGVYQLPKPISRNAHMQAGGDLLIATEGGLIPVSASVQRDVAALDAIAVSRPISPYWQDQAAKRGAVGWGIMKLPRLNIMIVSQPDTASQTCLVANLQTGAWSRFTGWDVQCMAYHADEGYFGGLDGVIRRMNASGADDGAIYTCVYVGQFESLGAHGQQKTVLQMRPVFKFGTPFIPKVSAQVDYSTVLSSPPSSPANFTTSTWDEGLWDEAIWDGSLLDETINTETGRPSLERAYARWVSIGRTGHSIAPELQLSFGNTNGPRVELVSIDVQWRGGAVVA